MGGRIPQIQVEVLITTAEVWHAACGTAKAVGGKAVYQTSVIDPIILTLYELV